MVALCTALESTCTAKWPHDIPQVCAIAEELQPRYCENTTIPETFPTRVENCRGDSFTGCLLHNNHQVRTYMKNSLEDYSGICRNRRSPCVTAEQKHPGGKDSASAARSQKAPVGTAVAFAHVSAKQSLQLARAVPHWFV